jgi:SAM-dependent methyltransferase
VTDHQPASLTSMEEGLEVMSAAVQYRKALARLAMPFLGDDPIEVGSGNGDYADTWASWGAPIVASEPAGTPSLARLEKRFAHDARVRVRALTLPSDEVGEYSTVVAFNVLEHIEDDLSALRSMARLLRPGGHVVLIVPAFDFAYGDWDRQIGHYRRYRRQQILDMLVAAEFQPVQVRYTNSVGLVAWWLMVRVFGQRPRDTTFLRLYDHLVVPLVFGFERAVRVPFGQSVLGVGQVRHEGFS